MPHSFGTYERLHLFQGMFAGLCWLSLQRRSLTRLGTRQNPLAGYLEICDELKTESTE